MKMPRRSKTLEPTIYYRGDSLPCMVCDLALNIGSNYPQQPASYSLELWCPACQCNSVYSSTKKILLVEGRATA